jgi:hypothetical protein
MPSLCRETFSQYANLTFEQYADSEICSVAEIAVWEQIAASVYVVGLIATSTYQTAPATAYNAGSQAISDDAIGTVASSVFIVGSQAQTIGEI